VGCKGCGKGDVKAIAKAGAAMSFAKRDVPVMPRPERTPGILRSPCRMCGAAIEQSREVVHETGYLRFCETCLPIAREEGREAYV
jgi:hypothetical protein